MGAALALMVGFSPAEVELAEEGAAGVTAASVALEAALSKPYVARELVCC